MTAKSLIPTMPTTLLDQRGDWYAPSHSYKLMGAPNQYGMDTTFGGDLEIDEATMSCWVPFASGVRRDGVGDLLEVAGIDTSRHRMNPIALFDHGKQVTLPIGLTEDANHLYSVQIDPVAREAKAKVHFYQGRGDLVQGTTPDSSHAIFCEQLFDLIAKKFIRAGSIGYQVKRATPLAPDYVSGVPQGLHLLQTILLEVSAVVMPANQDTVRKALSYKNLCGKPLSPYLIKSLTPYAAEKRAQLGWEPHLHSQAGPSRAEPLRALTRPAMPYQTLPTHVVPAPEPTGKSLVDIRQKYLQKAANKRGLDEGREANRVFVNAPQAERRASARAHAVIGTMDDYGGFEGLTAADGPGSVPLTDTVNELNRILDEDQKAVSTMTRTDVPDVPATTLRHVARWRPGVGTVKAQVRAIGREGSEPGTTETSGVVTDDGQTTEYPIEVTPLPRKEVYDQMQRGAREQRQHGHTVDLDLKWLSGRGVKYVTHDGGHWTVHAESGRVLGTHPSKEKAEAQLRAVEANSKNLNISYLKSVRAKYGEKAVDKVRLVALQERQAGGYNTTPEGQAAEDYLDSTSTSLSDQDWDDTYDEWRRLSNRQYTEEGQQEAAARQQRHADETADMGRAMTESGNYVGKPGRWSEETYRQNTGKALVGHKDDEQTDNLRRPAPSQTQSRPTQGVGRRRLPSRFNQTADVPGRDTGASWKAPKPDVYVSRTVADEDARTREQFPQMAKRPFEETIDPESADALQPLEYEYDPHAPLSQGALSDPALRESKAVRKDAADTLSVAYDTSESNNQEALQLSAQAVREGGGNEEDMRDSRALAQQIVHNRRDPAMVAARDARATELRESLEKPDAGLYDGKALKSIRSKYRRGYKAAKPGRDVIPPERTDRDTTPALGAPAPKPARQQARKVPLMSSAETADFWSHYNSTVKPRHSVETPKKVRDAQDRQYLKESDVPQIERGSTLSSSPQRKPAARPAARPTATPKPMDTDVIHLTEDDVIDEGTYVPSDPTPVRNANAPKPTKGIR